jgi:hypothetical protein
MHATRKQAYLITKSRAADAPGRVAAAFAPASQTEPNPA